MTTEEKLNEFKRLLAEDETGLLDKMLDELDLSISGDKIKERMNASLFEFLDILYDDYIVSITEKQFRTISNYIILKNPNIKRDDIEDKLWVGLYDLLRESTANDFISIIDKIKEEYSE